MNALTLQRRIDAPPAIVFGFLVERDKLLRWFGIAAALDPRVGGSLRIDVTGGDIVEGAYIEIIPNERVSFSWGWVGSPDVPPGSSTVTFDLAPDGAGTLLTLTHRGLPVPEDASHARGWTYFLDRLRTVASGGIAGPVSLTALAETEAVTIHEEHP